jgi:hypothetical protein
MEPDSGYLESYALLRIEPVVRRNFQALLVSRRKSTAAIISSTRMNRTIAVVLLVVALLVGAGVGYLFGANSQQPATSRITSFGVSGQACERMGPLLCGEELSFLVTNTTQFAKAVNGSGFIFEKNVSGGIGTGSNVTVTLVYYIPGTSPPDSSCVGFKSVVYVNIPLVDGFLPVSGMSISSGTPACSALPPTTG